MSKITRVTLDDDIFSKLNIQEKNNEDFFTQPLPKFFEDEVKNEEFVTTLKEEIKSLEKQIESLQIDNACVKNENLELQKKIDDLADMFPSAVTMLGKTPELKQIKRNRWIFSEREF